MARRLHIPLLSILLLLAGLARGHDFWIEPASFQPAAAEPLRVTLMVGDHGRGEAVPRNASRIVDFSARLLGADGASPKPIVGQDGVSPAGVVRLDRQGLWALAYRTDAKFLELEPAKFESYLREVGLESISRQRAAAGASEKPGRELYSRASKALVRAGQELPATGAFARRVGLTLELSPRTDPFGAPQQEFVLDLEYQGQPLADAVVRAIALDSVASDPAAKTAADAPKLPTMFVARSDETGRVRFAWPGRGRWLFATTHMVACPDPARADWESVWGSLTLELP